MVDWMEGFSNPPLSSVTVDNKHIEIKDAITLLKFYEFIDLEFFYLFFIFLDWPGLTIR